MSKRPRPDDGIEDILDISESEGGEMAPPAVVKRQATINNTAALRQSLEDVRQHLPWIERMEVVSAEPLDVSNVNDDLKLELGLYVSLAISLGIHRLTFELLQLRPSSGCRHYSARRNGPARRCVSAPRRLLCGDDEVGRPHAEGECSTADVCN